LVPAPHRGRPNPPVMEEMEPAYFSVSGRAAKMLGEDSVSNPVTALVELIKNSYDADATTVDVSFEGMRTGEGSIRVADDGDGMNQNALETRFLTVATDDKEKHPFTDRFKRRKLGQKGIGRFAIEGLGGVVKLKSMPRGATQGYAIDFDWKEYAKPGVHLDKVPNPRWRFAKPKSKHGLEIEISELRGEWTQEMVDELRRDVALFVTPPGVFGSRKFSVQVSAPDFKIYRLKVKSTLLRYANFVFNADFKADGTVGYRIKEYRGRTMRDTVSQDPPSCGPFSMHFYFFYRLRNRQTTPELENLGILEILDRFGGIKLYRDQVRVRPHGDPGHDWLGLEEMAVHEPSRYPRTDNVLGHVMISADRNSKIIDTTTREKVVENAEYRVLVNLTRKAISKFADWRGELEQKQRGKTAKGKRRKRVKRRAPVSEGFLDFSARYPQIFYRPIEDEINNSYSSNLANATLILSRKLVENLVYELFFVKYPREVELRYDTAKNRPRDFGALVDSLEDRKRDFTDESGRVVAKFLSMVRPFKRSANSKAHNIMEYLQDRKELEKLKIPEIVDLALRLIEILAARAGNP